MDRLHAKNPDDIPASHTASPGAETIWNAGAGGIPVTSRIQDLTRRRAPRRV